MTDSHNSPNFIQYLIKLFYLVGGVLVAGTLITVIIDVSFEMSLAVAAIVGLSIALVKAGFVIFIFMHYKWDKKLIMITWTMILTFVFFAGMMGLIMWAEGDIPRWGRKEVPIVWPVLASLLGLILPASFAMFTVKILSQPIAVESEKDPKPKAKRVARKKKLSQPIAVESEKVPKPKAKQATRKKKQD
jgi:cytochrome c oxidase subunit IV